MSLKITIELINQIRDDAELTAMARVIEGAQREAWWQGFGSGWDKARISAYMLRAAGFGLVGEVEANEEGSDEPEFAKQLQAFPTMPAPGRRQPVITTAAVEAATEEFLRADRDPCECRRSPFDKHTVNPPCSTRREVTTRMHSAIEAAAAHVFAGVVALMDDPEHYDSYGPSEGYVSVENLRKAIAGTT